MQSLWLDAATLYRKEALLPDESKGGEVGFAVSAGIVDEEQEDELGVGMGWAEPINFRAGPGWAGPSPAQAKKNWAGLLALGLKNIK